MNDHYELLPVHRNVETIELNTKGLLKSHTHANKKEICIKKNGPTSVPMLWLQFVML